MVFKKVKDYNDKNIIKKKKNEKDKYNVYRLSVYNLLALTIVIDRSELTESI